MLETIRDEARLCASYTGRPVLSDKVMQVMGEIPRHRFVPASLRCSAYDNCALPVGCGQTISQPFIVALMTDLLDLNGTERVLEVGTGTGYQTAVLSKLCAEVHTVERIAELSLQARERLEELGLSDHVHFHVADGSRGWPQAAPFDGILVTAAAKEVPAPLLEQLAPGGRMVIPVGQAGRTQQLCRVCKHTDGKLDMQALLPVAFVPLISEGGSGS